MTQLSLLDAIEARDKGIKRAADHADHVSEGWSEKAFNELKMYIKAFPGEFMAEDFRRHAELTGLSDPPSKRAYGAVIVRAAKSGLIKRVGYGQTSNPLSHRTPASVWIKN